MIADSVKFRGYRCFQEEFSGFDEIKPINVIIGRNNTGKSHLLELVRIMTEAELPGNKVGQIELLCRGALDENSLKASFSPNTRGGILGHDHWAGHGANFVGVEVEWEARRGKPRFLGEFSPEVPGQQNVTTARIDGIRKVLSKFTTSISGREFRHLFADRDIVQEPAIGGLDLDPGGRGATNIVRGFINLENRDRNVIQRELLAALNEIFGPDGQFNEITIQQVSPDQADQPASWEIYLGEEHKEIIALSASGSGLKTIFLVLLNLIVVRKLDTPAKGGYVFAFEELENNLHPALLRRLLSYLEKHAVEKKEPIFLTTHSSVALDVFGSSPNAQIIRVEHDGRRAVAKNVSSHLDRFSVVSELGLKPSDLLQSNGIVWVEGPSDRVYLNRWIELFSNGGLVEGRDYQCAYYGGSLLGRSQFAAPEEADIEEFANLFWVNPRFVLVADSDRTAQTGKGSRIKDRLRRVKTEVEAFEHSHLWITDAKEIENYLPGKVLDELFEKSGLPDPGRHEYFFPTQGSQGNSYLAKQLKSKSVNKMEMAIAASPHMTRENLENRFDLKPSVEAIIEKIYEWNG